MSNLLDFEKHQEAILALLAEKIKSPTIPIANYVQEAEDQATWGEMDTTRLTTVGFNIRKLGLIRELAGAVRYTQTEWNKELNSRSEAGLHWKEESHTGFNLRDELVHTFYFVFRNEPELKKQVEAIDKGNSNADMIQDLSDLAGLGKANLDLLTPVMDCTKLDMAENLSDSLATTLAAVNGDRNSPEAAKILRDRAYTKLKELVDEVREYGKFVFWREPERLKGYRSEYLYRKNQKESVVE